jgi:hypothetical protein
VVADIELAADNPEIAELSYGDQHSDGLYSDGHDFDYSWPVTVGNFAAHVGYSAAEQAFVPVAADSSEFAVQAGPEPRFVSGH